MARMGFSEGLIILCIAIIKFGIPIAVAVWIILTLRRIRSDHELIQSKLEAIERLLQSSSKS